MKRSFFSILIVLAALSCEEQKGIVPPPVETAELEVDTNELNFTDEGGSKTIGITTNTRWTASAVNDRASDWLTIEPGSGEAGSATINVSAAANTTPDDRSASITISAGDQKKIVKVSQKQKDALSVTSSMFEVAADGGEIHIEAKANVKVDFSIDATAQEWIEKVETRAMATYVQTFRVKENESSSKREGTITISNGTLSETVTVYQEGIDPSIILSKNEISVSSEENEISIDVRSNVDVTVEIPADADWITEVSTKSMSTNTYTFRIAANEGHDNRSAKIRFVNHENGLTETVAVIQKQKDALTVTSYRFDVPYEGEIITIEVKANIDFEYKIDDATQPWVAFAGTKSLDSHELIFNVMPNTIETEREGRITFFSGELSETVTIYQRGPEPSIMILGGKDMTIGSYGGSMNVEVKSNVEVEMVIPENVNWIKDITTRSMSATQFTLEIAENENYEPRTAKVAFINEEAGLSDTLYVKQLQKDALVIATDEYRFSGEGGELKIDMLTTTEEINVNIDPEAEGWITQVETKAMMEKTLCFQIAGLEPNKVRRGTISFSTPGGAHQQVNVTQSSLETIDGTQVPDDEIWYRTVTNSITDLDYSRRQFNVTQPFDRTIISHTYENGLGVIKFDGPVKLINKFTFTAPVTFISEIYLPDCIEHIGDGAISSNMLTTIRIPENLQRVDNFGISSPYLEKFTGHHISEDGRCLIIDKALYAFAPAGLKDYTFPSGIEQIKSNVIRECNDLETITFSEGLKEMQYLNINRCPKLKKVTFPESLEQLGSPLFDECPSLEGFYGNEKFHTADNRCLITYQEPPLRPESWHGLWLVKFAGGGLTEYTIPDDIKVIDNNAIDGWESLKKLTLSDDLVYVSASAIVNCPDLEGVFGPNTSSDHRGIQIGDEYVRLIIHDGYPGTYHVPDDVRSIGIWAFSGITTLEHITMGDQITNIGGYAFSECHNLKSVTLSGGLERIGTDANIGYNPFLKSHNLESIYFRSYVPPTYLDSQMSEFDRLTVYVPSLSADLYKRDTGWEQFRKYMKEYECEDLTMPDYYVSTDFSKNGEVTLLHEATEGNGIDLVLMGDIYSDRQIESGLYREDMELAMDAFFGLEPFKSFKKYFNVYMVTAVSAVEEMYKGSTAFNTQYPPHNANGVSGYDPLAMEYAAKAVGEERMDEVMVVVMINDPKFAGVCLMLDSEKENDWGSGASLSYFPVSDRGDALVTLIQHETGGHGFAKLDDEYIHPLTAESHIPADEKLERELKFERGWYKNVDFTESRTEVKWAHMLEDERYAADGLGVYLGGSTYGYGVWRPSESGIMNDNTGGFNAPSREAIYYRIHKLAFGDDWVYDYEDFVEYDAINRIPASESASIKKASRRTRIQASPPVIRNKTWKEVVESGRNGTFVIGE